MKNNEFRLIDSLLEVTPGSAEYVNITNIKKGYKDQLIYYYNNVGKASEIAGSVITDKLISTIEKRYRQLGGSLPVPEKDILAKKGKKWRIALD